MSNSSSAATIPPATTTADFGTSAESPWHPRFWPLEPSRSNQYIAVGCRVHWPSVVLPGVLVLAISAAALAAAMPGQPVRVVLLLAMATAAGCAAAGIRWYRRRIHVEAFDRGFRLIDRDGIHHYHDDQVTALSIVKKPHYFMGERLADTRRLELHAHANYENRSWTIVDSFPADAADPLDPLTSRLQESLYQRASAAVHAQRRFEGLGWALQNGELHTELAGEKESLHLNDLAAVDVRDNALCLWKQGVERPVVRISTDTGDTWLLERILREHCADQQSVVAEPNSQSLGRILFERRAGATAVWMCAFVAGVSVLVGLSFLLRSIAENNPVSAYAGVVTLMLAASSGLAGMRFTPRCISFAKTDSVESQCAGREN